ncbi:MAG: hypothetical protein RBU45_26310, partial [Myxococcota bacterium]|nr:hypothetical protein [Myxococcota bacterium]
MQRVEIAAGSFRQLLRAGWRALVGLLVLTCLPGAAVGQTVPPEGQVIAEDAEDLPEPASRTGTPVPAVAPPPALPAVIAPPPAPPAAIAPPPAPPAAIAPPPAPPAV